MHRVGVVVGIDVLPDLGRARLDEVLGRLHEGHRVERHGAEELVLVRDPFPPTGVWFGHEGCGRGQLEFLGRRRPVRASGQGFGDPELHDFRDYRPHAGHTRVVDRRVVVRQRDVRTHGHLTEVHDQVVPLGRRDQEVQHLQRSTEAAVGADQPERQCGLRQYIPGNVEPQPPETLVRSVENAQPVASRLDGQERVRLPVDDRGVLAFPVGHGVGERAVTVEGPVLKDERDLEFASRQPEPLVGGVTDEVETGKARIDVDAGHSHAVVVIPEHAGALVVGVAGNRFVGFDPARVQGGVGLGMEAVRAERLERHTVGLWCGETAVLVYDVPHIDMRGKGRFAFVGRRSGRGELGVPVANAVDHELEQMGGRQLVAVLDDRRAVLGHIEGRPQIAHADRLAGIVRVRGPVTPHRCRPEVPVEAPRALPHRDVVVVGARIDGRIRDGCHRRGQRVDVPLQRRGLRHRGVRRSCPVRLRRILSFQNTPGKHGRTPHGTDRGAGHEEFPSPEHRLQPSIAPRNVQGIQGCFGTLVQHAGPLR